MAPQPDLSALLGGGVESARGRCLRCQGPLDTETWWVTAYPHGEHTRCRDWSGQPFPFARHLELLRRVWRQHRDPVARGAVSAVGAWLSCADRAWPKGGAQVVVDGLSRLHGLRPVLASAGVAQKVLNHL